MKPLYIFMILLLPTIATHAYTSSAQIHATVVVLPSNTTTTIPVVVQASTHEGFFTMLWQWLRGI